MAGSISQEGVKMLHCILRSSFLVSNYGLKKEVRSPPIDAMSMLNLVYLIYKQGSHRLEKYLNIQDCVLISP